MFAHRLLMLILCLQPFALTSAHDLWVETNTNAVPLDEPVEVAFKLGNCDRGRLTFRTAGLLDKSGVSFFEVQPSGKRRLIAQDLTRSSDGDGGYWHTIKEMKERGATWFCQTLDQAIEHDGKRMRGILSAKAMVLAGQGVNLREFEHDKAIGFPLELVLHSSPLPSIDDAKSVDLQLLLNGKSISGVNVSFMRQALDPQLNQVSNDQVTTDDTGKVIFKPTRPGLYLISARHIENTRDQGDSIYYSTSITLRISRHTSVGSE